MVVVALKQSKIICREGPSLWNPAGSQHSYCYDGCWGYPWSWCWNPSTIKPSTSCPHLSPQSCWFYPSHCRYPSMILLLLRVLLILYCCWLSMHCWSMVHCRCWLHLVTLHLWCYRWPVAAMDPALDRPKQHKLCSPCPLLWGSTGIWDHLVS